MSRISAFTLLELLVVMVISTVLLAISYQAIDLAQKSYWRFQSDNSEALNVKRLMIALTNDFESAQTVICSSDEIHCVNGENSIHYRFSNGKVIRSNAQTEELFPIQMTAIRFFVDNIEKRPIHETVDEVEISLRFNREILVFPLRRNKSYYDYFQHWAASQ